MFFWSYKDVFQSNEYQLFKWFTFVRGGGGGGQTVQDGLSCPPPRIWVNQCHQLILIAIYCDIYMFFWSYKDVFQSNKYQLFTFVRGVGGKLSRLVYLASRPGFGSNSVIS